MFRLHSLSLRGRLFAQSVCACVRVRFSSVLPCQTQDRVVGPSQHRQDDYTHTRNALLAYLVSVCSATEWTPPTAEALAPALPPSPQSQSQSPGVGGDSESKEVEEGRRGGRPDPAEGPGSSAAVAGWPRAGRSTGTRHTGSPKRCFFFFAGFRGASRRRSSSVSDSSISSSAEIRISDSDSSWDAALR